MSLLSDAMEKCVILNKQTVADGYGGYITMTKKTLSEKIGCNYTQLVNVMSGLVVNENMQYVEGAEFDAAIVFDTSMQARTAEKAGVTSLYTVTTSRALTLEYHDVFKRLTDGKIFRVTSDGDDKYTPQSATLDMRQVTAEEYTIGGDNGG